MNWMRPFPAKVVMFIKKGCVLLPERVRPFSKQGSEAPISGAFPVKNSVRDSFSYDVRIVYEKGFIVLLLRVACVISIVYCRIGAVADLPELLLLSFF